MSAIASLRRAYGAVAPGSDREPREIPVRRPSFDFARVKERHWFGGDPFKTHLLQALSGSFPEGERFFMDAVRFHLDKVKTPALRHEISRFLAQEGMHGKAHAAFNEWVKSLGNDIETIERDVQSDLAQTRLDARPIEWLAATCALEHFTAILAERLLDDDDLRAQLPPEVRALWVWHAVEETEHKAVAFDTYVEVGGTYRMRAISMVIVTLGFLYQLTRHQLHLIKHDPERPSFLAVARGWAWTWIWPGTLLPVIPAYFDYYRPGFHPWQRAPRAKFRALRDAMDQRSAPMGAA
jgi:predicted metal-dependent hydrolase